jgi:hypothetical protein
MSKLKPKQTIASFMNAVRAKVSKQKQQPSSNKSAMVRSTRTPPNSRQGPLRLSSTVNSGATNRLSQVIEEDEYIAEVNGSIGFATTQYNVNIGQSSTFPWGYKIAALYEKYDFDYIEFYYKREVSEYAANGQTGKVMLSFDYDASDSPPTNKQQVEDTVPHIDGMPCSETLRLKLDCAAMKKQPSIYIRPGLQPANTDIKTFDKGLLFVSTQGNANTTIIGELRVRYRCVVKVPVLESGVVTTGSAGAQLLISSALIGEAAAATTVYAPLFASATNPIVLANGIGAVVASTGLITFNSGTYLIEVSNVGSDTAAAVTAGTIEFNDVVTPNTGVVLTSGVGVTTGAFPTYNAWSNNLSMVWSTALFGTAFCAQAALTYASGSALNHSSLRITQL